MASVRAPKSRKLEGFLFFVCGIGSTIAWTAILANLVFYTVHLGASSFIYLNLAVYIPSFPIALAQAKWDSEFDQKYQSLNTFLFRGTLSYALSCLAVLLVPMASYNVSYLVTLTVVLGLTSAILQGTMKQMAAFVYEESDLLQAAVSSGMQGSAIFVLIVALSTGFGDDGNPAGLLPFNFSILGIKVFCWAIFYVLMTRSNDVMVSMQQRDAAMSMRSNSKMHLALLEDDPLLLDESETGTSEEEMSYKTLWKRTWKCCMSLIITLVSSMLVAAYLNRVPSATNNIEFPQVLFYAKMIPDVLGRPATILYKLKSENYVLGFSIFRFLFVPVFLIYVLTDLIPRNDTALTVALAIFSFFSGYIVTLTYQIAPQNLSAAEKVNSPNQANLLSICFSSSILGGLLIGLIMISSGY